MRRLYIALTLLAAPAAFSLEAPTPAMTLVNSSIQLGPDQSGVRKGELFIRADNFDKASFDPTKLKITDLAPARLSTVVFEAATVVSKQDAGAIWRVGVQATKWPPMSSAKGKIMLELGEKREVLDVAYPERLHAQDYARQRRAQDLGVGEFRARVVIVFAI